MELDEGSISVDGVNIAKLGLAQLRNAMAIIPQVTFRALITNGSPGISDCGSWERQSARRCFCPALAEGTPLPKQSPVHVEYDSVQWPVSTAMCRCLLIHGRLANFVAHTAADVSVK